MSALAQLLEENRWDIHKYKMLKWELEVNRWQTPRAEALMGQLAKKLRELNLLTEGGEVKCLSLQMFSKAYQS